MNKFLMKYIKILLIIILVLAINLLSLDFSSNINQFIQFGNNVYADASNTINTSYGQVIFDTTNNLLTINQNVDKIWYLSGYRPNGTVSPDKVYLNIKVSFFDGSSNCIENKYMPRKEVNFNVKWESLFDNDWSIIRLINIYKAGPISMDCLYTPEIINNTKKIQVEFYYSGYWNPNHWSDGNVNEMSFYSEFSPPKTVTKPRPVESFSYSFNQQNNQNYSQNTTYGQMLFDTSNNILTINQNVNKTWYLSGSKPNHTVTPDRVYLNISVSFLDSSSNPIATAYISNKQVEFGVIWPDLYDSTWSIIRQINFSRAGVLSTNFLYTPEVLSNTRSIKVSFNYVGSWNSNHWTDGVICEMDIYSKYSVPMLVNRYDIETHNYTFNSEPQILSTYPTDNSIIGEANVIIPRMLVSDNNGNTLNCRYFLDSEALPRNTVTVSNTITAQEISFESLNISMLQEGFHTLTFEVSDNIAPPVRVERNIIIDKQRPILGNVINTSTDTSISISGTASDSLSGMHSSPYRYSLGTNQSQWSSDAFWTFNNLTPNTQYITTFEAKDNAGNIANIDTQILTKAQVPDLKILYQTDNSITIRTEDEDPSNTQYLLSSGSKYINNSGDLVDTPTWITLVNKEINIRGLNQNTLYSFQAKARNAEGTETSISTAISGTTLTVPPSLTFKPSRESMTLNWQAIPGVLNYDIEADGRVTYGVSGTTFMHTGLVPDTQHNYRIRAINAGGAGSWSNEYTIATYPNPPEIPINLQESQVSQTSVTFSWSPSLRATEYIVEANGIKVESVTNTIFTHSNLTPDTSYAYRVIAKNAGGESSRSEALTVETLPVPPPVPLNIKTQLTKDSVTVIWDKAERASGYEIKADGLIIDAENYTTYIHSGLSPLTEHTYTIRAVNRGGKSNWSAPLTVTTYPPEPGVPTNILTTAEKNLISVIWYNVEHAESYDIETDGNIITGITDISFEHSGLAADSKHTYKIRAKNVSGLGEWSSPVFINTLPDMEDVNITLTNVVAIVTNRMITVSWDTVARDAEYYIEVDGDLLDIGKSTVYNHTELDAETYHTYKIRVKRDGSESDWCSVISLSTLPNPPDAPTGVEAIAYDNSIELRWVKVNGATGYDIEVDGEIKNSTAPNLLHNDLESGTSHTYRVRAKNMSGITAWSTAIVKSTTSPSFFVKCEKGMIFDFSVLAHNVQDFTGVKFIVTYNKDELDLVDLYGLTPKEDQIAEGQIPGTNLYVKYTPGRIDFLTNMNIKPGTSWSGELTSIVFKAKIDGQSKMELKVE